MRQRDYIPIILKRLYVDAVMRVWIVLVSAWSPSSESS